MVTQAASPCKVADVGGWLLKFGNMAALDKALDTDPCSNHEFLQQADNLIAQKVENPGLRITKVMRESVRVVEEKKQGLRKPKRKFLTIEAFERQFGSVDHSRVKTQRIDGVEVKGVDVVDINDQGVYTYIDESVSSVQRDTELSNADLTVSKEQASTVFSTASKHLAWAPKDDTACVVVKTHASGSQGTLPAATSTEDSGAAATGERDAEA